MRDTPPVPQQRQFTCAMCNGVFDFSWSEAEAVAEAESKGIDPSTSGLVCDDCYKLTPWGQS